MNTRYGFAIACIALSLPTSLAHAEEVSPRGTWHVLTDSLEAQLFAGDQYGVLTFRQQTDDRVVTCNYALDLGKPASDAMLMKRNTFNKSRSEDRCEATMAARTVAAANRIEVQLNSETLALDATLERMTALPEDPLAVPAPDFDIVGLRLKQSENDLKAVLNEMEGVQTLGVEASFEDASSTLQYNVGSVAPDPEAYAAACDAGSSSGHRIENTYLALSGAARPGSDTKLPIVISRWLSPLPGKQPLASALSSSLNAKYGEPTSPGRWVFDREGRLFKAERVTNEHGTEREAVTIRDENGKVVTTIYERPDRLCSKGERFHVERMVGSYSCGRNEFDFPTGELRGTGSKVAISEEAHCGAVLEIRIESRGDYAEHVTFVATDILAGRAAISNIASEQIDTIIGQAYRKLSQASEVEIKL